MKRLMISFRLLAVAGVFFFSSCQKQTVDAPGAAVSGSTTINSRIGTSGQQVKVSLTTAQAAQFRQTGRVTVDPVTIEGINPGGGGIGINPNGCPPIPASFFTYWEAQANACCCTVVACAQDETCAFVLFAFSPNCGPGGGGEWQ